jgi:hypothetical protein
MSKRLQVILDDAEMKQIRAVARRKKMTVAEWVRQTLRAARESEPSADPRRKLEALRTAVGHRFPTADMKEILAQIESR